MKTVVKVVQILIGLFLATSMFGVVGICITDFSGTCIILLIIYGSLCILFCKWIFAKKQCNDIAVSTDNFSQSDIYEEGYESYDQLYAEIDDGTLPNLDVDNLMLKKNEICHFEEDAVLIISKSVISGYAGASSGVSVRVAKCINIRTGASRGSVVREEEFIEHEGSLYITNKRVVFISSTSPFSVDIVKINAVKTFEDGIELQSNTKLYTILVDSPILASKIIRICAAQ